MQRLAIAAALCLTITACAASSAADLEIAGSTSLQPVLEIVGESFAKGSGIAVRVQGGGSTAGIHAVVSGVVPVGAISRRLTEDETNQGLVEHIIGYDVLTVVVHPDNRVAEMTLAQIGDLFSGKITDWARVGGGRGRVHLVTREAGSGSREAFRGLVGPISPRAIVQGSSGAIRVAVMHDPQAIGYVSFGTVGAGGLKPIVIDGRRPGDLHYSLIRPLSLVTQGPATGHALAFMNFARGPEGERLLQEEGLVSVREVLP